MRIPNSNRRRWLFLVLAACSATKSVRAFAPQSTPGRRARRQAFPNGGMDIHIRTKINTWWSFIESAVLQLGSDLLEVKGGPTGGQYWINGVAGSEGDSNKMPFSAYRLTTHRVSNGQMKYRIDFGNGKDAIAPCSIVGWNHQLCYILCDSWNLVVVVVLSCDNHSHGTNLDDGVGCDGGGCRRRHGQCRLCLVSWWYRKSNEG